MPDTRQKDKNWSLPDPMDWQRVPVALLMDIRDELKQLNRVFACHNFKQKSKRFHRKK